LESLEQAQKAHVHRDNQLMSLEEKLDKETFAHKPRATKEETKNVLLESLIESKTLSSTTIHGQFTSDNGLWTGSQGNFLIVPPKSPASSKVAGSSKSDTIAKPKKNENKFLRYLEKIPVNKQESAAESQDEAVDSIEAIKTKYAQMIAQEKEYLEHQEERFRDQYKYLKKQVAEKGKLGNEILPPTLLKVCNSLFPAF
jgi:hypothetical protein